MPKLLVKQENGDGTTTLVYNAEKGEIVMVTGISPNVYHVEVVTKDKMYELLREMKG